MRMIATAMVVCLAATAADAACLPNDLGCAVHGGSGLVYDQGRFTPRTDMSRGSYYINQPAQPTIVPRRRAVPYDPADPAQDPSAETDWRDFDMRDGDMNPWTTPEEWRRTQTQQTETERRYAPTDAPYAQPGTRRGAVTQRRGPSSGPQAPADSPQGAASSAFSTTNQTLRR